MISRYILRAFPATLFICFAAAPVRPAYGFMLTSGTLTHLISDLPGTVANALQYNGEKFGFKINLPVFEYLRAEGSVHVLPPSLLVREKILPISVFSTL